VAEWVTTNKPLIQAAMLKELGKTKGALAKAFTEGLANAVKCDYSIRCDVKFDSPK
jgi:hypothetical protein